MNSPWEHFSVEELTCRCGCGRMEMDEEFMGRVVKLRKRLGFAFPVTSGFRCPEYNMDVSATGRTGPHTRGRALDIQMYGSMVYKLIQFAPAFSMHGVGLKQKGPYPDRFIHLDDLTEDDGYPRPWIWSY